MAVFSKTLESIVCGLRRIIVNKKYSIMSVNLKGSAADYQDKSRRRRRRELTEEQKQEIVEAFNLFDSDKDQALDYHELKVSDDTMLADSFATTRAQLSHYSHTMVSMVLKIYIHVV